ncbi:MULTISPECIES: hypothetical protein [unclassified Moorena]|uniref:hypothetical protein n=1 Tax=unclassified Moorena TaxID=2683338 RepID=UPI0014001BCE|nr:MULTISPECIES: hypothetical protein [unclassified Moorena]NEO11134.1 hypothetical protein [Moorena sp. SIO3E8]NEO43859.1 hypothetical protein [Moorena sp. SIO4A3]NEP98042.1 hypothetical protein [Moorena sp. SIO3F7]
MFICKQRSHRTREFRISELPISIKERWNAVLGETTAVAHGGDPQDRTSQG